MKKKPVVKQAVCIRNGECQGCPWYSNCPRVRAGKERK
jgi:hypothetical protein